MTVGVSINIPRGGKHDGDFDEAQAKLRQSQFKLVPRQRLWPRFDGVVYGVFGFRRSDEGTKMRSKYSSPKEPAEQVIKDIRRAQGWSGLFL